MVHLSASKKPQADHWRTAHKAVFLVLKPLTVRYLNIQYRLLSTIIHSFSHQFQKCAKSGAKQLINMKNLAFRFVYDKNKRATESKPQPLYIEVRLMGTNQAVYLNTGIKLYPNQFSDKNGFTCKNHDRASLVTVRAKKILYSIEEFSVSDKCLKIEDIKLWNKEDTYSNLVVDFIQAELKKTNPSDNVLKRQRGLIKHIEAFAQITTFGALSYAVIDNFDIYLKKTIKSSEALYKVHGMLRKHIYKAVKLGVCSINPYDDFKLTKGQALEDPVFLIDEEVERIKAYNPPDDKLDRARDLFIFQCYTGLAYSDLMAFDKLWVYEESGYNVFRDKRKKTGEGFFVLLLPEAEDVLKKYDWVLPKLSLQKYNDYLKIIQMACGIRKRITSHSSRHTFACMLLNNGVPVTTVSKTLGHSSLKQTLHYARLLGKTVVEDMAKLINKNPPNLTT